jgi:G3E family GTPase
MISNAKLVYCYVAVVLQKFSKRIEAGTLKLDGIIIETTGMAGRGLSLFVTFHRRVILQSSKRIRSMFRSVQAGEAGARTAARETREATSAGAGFRPPPPLPPHP